MPSRPFFLLAALAVCASSFAQDYKVGDIRIERPYARPTVPNQPAAGAYVTLENLGTTADRLVAASSPIARSVEIHTMSMDKNNVMRMREIGKIDLPPKTRTTMKPGDGFHLMLLGINQPLKAGDKFPLTLTFDKAGKVETSVTVNENPAMPEKSAESGMSGMGHHR